MKYCDGIDCSWCSQPEPCIYKEANRLQTQLKEKEIECNKLKEQLEQTEALKETYLTCYKAKHEDINGELFKLKQILNDIKEIVEKEYNDCDDCYRDTDTNCDVDCIDCSLGAQANLAEQILQKISEI